MNRRLLAPAAAVLALGGFLAACGDDKKSREDLVSELAEEGSMTEEQATCVYDALGDDANDFLNQNADDADDADYARLSDAAAGCAGGDLTIPDLGDISIPDIADFTLPEISVP